MACFWTSSWLDGKTPRDLALNLFRKAKRKKLTVKSALKENRWIQHILPIQTAQEMNEYVVLWEGVRDINLEDNREDEIRWRWMTDGEYTTKSAYQIQFEGTFSKFKLMPIWKAAAEPKCKFFAWTLLHEKILTASNLSKRNWPNDPICKLCGIDPETPTHLCRDCPFSLQVWNHLKQWLNLSAMDSVNSTGSLHSYWRKCRTKFDRAQRKVIDGIFIYFWWSIWKERNRRVFQQQSLQPIQVAMLCRDDLQEYNMARRTTSSKD